MMYALRFFVTWILSYICFSVLAVVSISLFLPRTVLAGSLGKERVRCTFVVVLFFQLFSAYFLKLPSHRCLYGCVCMHVYQPQMCILLDTKHDFVVVALSFGHVTNG